MIRECSLRWMLRQARMRMDRRTPGNLSKMEKKVQGKKLLRNFTRFKFTNALVAIVFTAPMFSFSFFF
ncbi:hypothetical protein HanIR_Chr14g0713811 [Helianthus annuus]|nr:hypothetical protein HanIR_Chr14g0713811 [Helianthus annuus]